MFQLASRPNVTGDVEYCCLKGSYSIDRAVIVAMLLRKVGCNDIGMPFEC